MKLKALVFLTLTAFIFSCNKDDDYSMYEYLHGSWTLVQVGADTNNNQIMEPAELVTLPDTGVITTIFNADGTGIGAFNINQTLSVDAKFRWTTNEKEQMLVIHSLEDSTTYHANFKALNSRNFYLLNNDVTVLGSKVWLVYTRK